MKEDKRMDEKTFKMSDYIVDVDGQQVFTRRYIFEQEMALSRRIDSARCIALAALVIAIAAVAIAILR